MAQLANDLRITLSNRRVESPPGGFLQRRGKPKDAEVWMDYRAEIRRREGVEWTVETAAEGRITGAEALYWAEWLRAHAQPERLPLFRKKDAGDAVARLWTPLAGQNAEFFLWADPAGGLAMLALFTPDDANPHHRIGLETSVSPDDITAFAQALEADYAALRDG
ncbi:MAG TPA: hypothetical protein VGM37_02035 [Armatimonadota bacterium]|jgi:hypothetical protein